MNPWLQLELVRDREREVRRMASASGRGRRTPRPRPRAHPVRRTGLLMIRVGARLAGPAEPAPLLAPRLSRTS